MFKKIVVVRHGQTLANSMNILQGSTDEYGLTPKGKAEVESVREAVLFHHPDVILYSPLKRTKETAMILRNYLSYDIHMIPDSGISAMNLGILQGKSWDFLKSEYGITKEYLDEGKLKRGDVLKNGVEVYDGESDPEYQARIEEYYNYLKVAPQYDGKTLLVVSHGYCMYVLMRVSGNTLESLEVANSRVGIILP